MSEKKSKLSPNKRIRNLEAKINQLITEFNASEKEHIEAFNGVGKALKDTKARLTTIENMLLVGDFTEKLAKGDILRRPPG